MSATDPNTYFCSFSGFKPFKKNGTPKNGLIFYDWLQNPPSRHCVIATNTHFSVDAFFFYSDYQKSLAEVSAMLGVPILSQAAFEEHYWQPRLKARKEAIVNRITAARDIFGRIQPGPPQKDDTGQPSLLSDHELHFQNMAALEKHLKQFEDNDFVTVYLTQDWGTFAYQGLIRYVRNRVKDTYGQGFEADPHYLELCRKFGLEYHRPSCLKPIRPLRESWKNSLYGYSVDGGTKCNAIAINLVSGRVVPLDAENDISTHKHGWSYAHKYLGLQHGCENEMVILRRYHKGVMVDLGFCPEELLGEKSQRLFAYLAKLSHLNGASPRWSLDFNNREETQRPLSYWLEQWEQADV